MFLDDQLIQIANSGDKSHWSYREATKSKMIKALLENIQTKAKQLVEAKSASDQEFLIHIKRCRSMWYMAATKLEKSGNHVLTAGSFESVIETEEMFSRFRSEILKYLKR